MTQSRNAVLKLAKVALPVLGLAVAGTALPWSPDHDATAVAKGGGGGGSGGGPGGGNGGGSGNGSGNSGNGPSADKAEPGSRGNPGQARGQENGARPEASEKADKAGAAAALGALNAAHASPTARAHAAPNSRVGQIAVYEMAMQDALAMKDPAAQAAAIVEARSLLADAANKPVTDAVVARVDSLLGLDTTPAPSSTK